MQEHIKATKIRAPEIETQSTNFRSPWRLICTFGLMPVFRPAHDHEFYWHRFVKVGVCEENVHGTWIQGGKCSWLSKRAPGFATKTEGGADVFYERRLLSAGGNFRNAINR